MGPKKDKSTVWLNKRVLLRYLYNRFDPSLADTVDQLVKEAEMKNIDFGVVWRSTLDRFDLRKDGWPNNSVKRKQRRLDLWYSTNFPDRKARVEVMRDSQMTIDNVLKDLYEDHFVNEYGVNIPPLPDDEVVDILRLQRKVGDLYKKFIPEAEIPEKVLAAMQKNLPLDYLLSGIARKYTKLFPDVELSDIDSEAEEYDWGEEDGSRGIDGVDGGEEEQQFDEDGNPIPRKKKKKKKKAREMETVEIVGEDGSVQMVERPKKRKKKRETEMVEVVDEDGNVQIVEVEKPRRRKKKKQQGAEGEEGDETMPDRPGKAGSRQLGQRRSRRNGEQDDDDDDYMADRPGRAGSNRARQMRERGFNGNNYDDYDDSGRPRGAVHGRRRGGRGGGPHGYDDYDDYDDSNYPGGRPRGAVHGRRRGGRGGGSHGYDDYDDYDDSNYPGGRPREHGGTRRHLGGRTGRNDAYDEYSDNGGTVGYPSSGTSGHGGRRGPGGGYSSRATSEAGSVAGRHMLHEPHDPRHGRRGHGHHPSSGDFHSDPRHDFEDPASGGFAEHVQMYRQGEIEDTMRGEVERRIIRLVSGDILAKASEFFLSEGLAHTMGEAMDMAVECPTTIFEEALYMALDKTMRKSKLSQKAPAGGKLTNYVL